MAAEETEDPAEAGDQPGERRHHRPPGVQVGSEALAGLAPDWAALHASVPGSPLFLHPSWFAAWLRHFGRSCAPVFLAFRLDEELVAVAALDLDADDARQLGDPNVMDYAGLLVLPGHESAVADALFDWLAADMTRHLRLWGLREDDPAAAAIGAQADGNGWEVTVEPEAVCPRITLPASWDAYLTGLSKHERHELRRKLRHLETAGTVTFERALGIEAVAGMDRFIDFMRTSRTDKAAFLTPEMEAFFRDLASAFATDAEEGGVLGPRNSELGTRMWAGSLTLDGRPIAMLFAFEDATTVSLYNSGYDPEYGSLAAGLLSKVLAIRDAITRGKTTFDFLRGVEQYKARLGGVGLGVRRMSLRRRY